MELPEFLAACLDEDEAAAKAAEREMATWGGLRPSYAKLGFAVGDLAETFNPARVLREVAAKRALVTELVPWLDGAEDDHWYNRGVGDQPPYEGSVLLLKTLAAVYSGHPGYDPVWAI
jgi:hypothetical protein